MRKASAIVAVFFAGFLAGCAGSPTLPEEHDFTVPQVVVVLPPINETADIRASDRFLSTFTTALGEYGYYVVPVAVVDRMMKENGVPTPGEMHAVAPYKFAEVFGADAVMYIRISYFGPVPGGAAVTAHYRLVDTATGNSLWERTHRNVYIDDGGMGLTGLLINTVIGMSVGPSQQQLRLTNVEAFILGPQRLMKGPRHPDYDAEQALVGGQSATQ